MSSRTGTINASLSITEPRLAWRYARATPGVTIDPLGPTIAEVDLALDGSRELIAVTDRSIAAWDAVSGRQRWPSGLGAYSPLQYIVGVADLNGDGRRDIVAVGRDNVVAVFDDAGELRWALPSNRVAGSFVGSARIVDMNGTGIGLQLLVARTDGSERLVLQLFHFDRDFVGTELRSTSVAGDAETSSARMQVGDFDADGVPDVLVLRTSSLGLIPLFIRGNGTTAGAWTPVTRTIPAPMGGCVPRASTTLRTETFAYGDRDYVAFKQGAVTGATGCVGVVRVDSMGPALLWSAPLPSGDSSNSPYIGNLIDGGEPELVVSYTEPVAGSSDPRSVIRVYNAVTGLARFTTSTAIVEAPLGYTFSGLATIDATPNATIVASSASTPATRFLFRHNGTNFARSSAYEGLNLDRAPRLIEGPQLYGLPSNGRLEPIVVESSSGAAVIARTSMGLLRQLTLARNVASSTTIAGTVVASRSARRGVLVSHLPAQPTQMGLRRLDAELRPEGNDFSDPDRGGPPLFMVSRPSYATATSFRNELRATKTMISPGDTVLSSNRGSVVDFSQATPFDVTPVFGWSELSCVDNIGASINAITSSGELIYLPTANPIITSGTLLIPDRTARRCQRSPLFIAEFLPRTITDASFTGDFFRVPIASPGSGSALLAIMQREAAPNREVLAGIRGVTPPQFEALSYPSALASSLPAMSTLNERSVVVILSPVGSSAPAPHQAHFFIGEQPLRALRAQIPTGLPINFAAQTPILVPATNNELLLVNSNPNTSPSTTYARPSVWRAAMSGAEITITPVAWSSASTMMDAQPAAVVRCGVDYRLLFRSRVTALDSEDARIEAWSFSRSVTAPATPDYAVDQGMSRAWTLCLDRRDYSCASPAPSPRSGRATFSGISAAQNGDDPVAVISNSAGQTFAIENVCSSSPRVRWRFEEPRQAAVPTLIDSDGDGQSEVVILSSDGTYHGIAQAECDQPDDARCPRARPRCDVAARTCVECLSDAECAEVGRGACDPVRRACSPCSSVGTQCEVSGGQCAELFSRAGVPSLACTCTLDEHCAHGFVCSGLGGDAGVSGTCTLGCNPAAPRCPVGLACVRSATGARCTSACASDMQCMRDSPTRPVCASVDGGTLQCVECASSAQCAARSPDHPVCSGNRCVQCNASDSAACARSARGPRCLADETCGCETDSDCAAGRCDRSTRACVAAADSGVTPPWQQDGCACDAKAPAQRSSQTAMAALGALAMLLRARKRRRRFTARITVAATFSAGLTLAPLNSWAQSEARSAQRAVQCGETAPAELFNDARERFEAGQSALLAGDPTRAERALREALALYDSPNTHLLLGRALLAQSRVEDAYDAFESAVLVATRCSIRDPTERGRARYTRSIEQGATERAQIAARVALLSVRFESGAPAGATIRIGERPALPLASDRTFAAPSGAAVSITIRAPGYQDWSGTVTLERGRVSNIDVSLQRIVERRRVPERLEPMLTRVRRTPPGFFVGLATGTVGLAAAGVGAALFAVGRGRFAALEQPCTRTMCPSDPSYLEAVDRGERIERIGMITLYTGIAITALGAVIAIAMPPRIEWVPAPSARTAALSLGVHLGSISLRGSF